MKPLALAATFLTAAGVAAFALFADPALRWDWGSVALFAVVLTAAAIPYWWRFGRSRLSVRQLAVMSMTVAALTLVWWIGVENLVAGFEDSEPAFAIIIAVAYLGVGVAWGGRALFPALLLILLAGGAEDWLEPVPPSDGGDPLLSASAGAVAWALVIVPMIAVGAAVRAWLVEDRNRKTPIGAKPLPRSQ